ALIVARHLLDAERRTLPKLRRQHDSGEFLRQGLREINHAHVAAGDGAGKDEKVDRRHVQPAISRSSALGLTARRCRMSSATSPTNASSMPCLSERTTALASAAGDTFGGGTV